MAEKKITKREKNELIIAVLGGERTLTDEERKLVFEIDDAVLYHEFLNLMDEKTSDEEPVVVADLEYDFCDFSDSSWTPPNVRDTLPCKFMDFLTITFSGVLPLMQTSISRSFLFVIAIKFQLFS